MLRLPLRSLSQLSSRRCIWSLGFGGDKPDPLNIVVIVGSSRAKRIGDKVAGHVADRAAARGHSLKILDPRTSHNRFFMTLMEKSYFHYKGADEGDPAPSDLEEAAADISAADAFIVVSPEYNHTVSPALTNTMNYFGAGMYAQKPSGIVTYSAGMWGGARCGVALRSYLSELGCLPVSATAQLAGAWKAGTFGEDGQLAEGSMASKLVERMLDQLEWHANSMRNHRHLAADESERFESIRSVSGDANGKVK